MRPGYTQRGHTRTSFLSAWVRVRVRVRAKAKVRVRVRVRSLSARSLQLSG